MYYLTNIQLGNAWTPNGAGLFWVTPERPADAGAGVEAGKSRLDRVCKRGLFK